jgi:hypothetical protein
MPGRRFLAAILLLLAPAGAARPSPPTDFRLAQAVQGQKPSTIVAYLDVRGADRGPVTELDPKALSATLADQPLTVGRVVPFRDAGEGVAYIFCVDISRSLSKADFAEVRAALGRWIAGMGPRDRAAVLAFGEESRLVTDFTANQEALRAALDALGPTDMKTVLYRGLNDALELSSRRDPELPSRRVLVMLSDGKDEGSGLAVEDVMVTLREHGLPLYAIGFGGPARRESLDLLLRFATNSGGDFVAVGGGDFDAAYAAMRGAIDRVWTAELDCPQCGADGSVRRLQVNLLVGGRVLSKGTDVRLLPPLATAAASAAPGAAVAPAAVVAPRAAATAPAPGAGTAPDDTSAASSRRGPFGMSWPIWGGLSVAVILAAAALARARRRAGGDGDEAETAAKRKPARQQLTRRERKQLDVPLDSEPLVPPVALCFTVVRGISEGSEHRFLLHRRGVLGSNSKCEFVVSEPELAAEQVELVQQEGAVYARNLSRSRPTLLNGAPLAEARPLGSGDLLGNRGFIARVRLG